MERKSPARPADRRYGLRLLLVTTLGLFTAEVLVMLLIEGWLGHLPVLLRVFLDATLLMCCVFPTLYFLVFQEMGEQIRLRERSEQVLEETNRTLGQMVEERTARLQRANQDLLGEVRERARLGMVLNQALKEANADRSNLQAVIDALSHGLMVVDAGGVVQLLNHAGEALLGENAYKLKSKPLAMLLAPALPDDELEHFIAAGEPGTTLKFGWQLSGGSVPAPLEMELAASCLWRDEPAVVLILRGVGQ